MTFLESLLHTGPIGLIAALVPILSTLFLLIRRVGGWFFAIQDNTPLELAWLLAAPLLVVLYAAGYSASATSSYFGKGLDAEHPLIYGMRDIEGTCILAFLCLLLSLFVFSLPKNKKQKC